MFFFVSGYSLDHKWFVIDSHANYIILDYILSLSYAASGNKKKSDEHVGKLVSLLRSLNLIIGLPLPQ